jgi:PAS domain S-box-containing protein
VTADSGDLSLLKETLLLHEEILRRLTEGVLLTHGSRGTIDFATSRLERMFGYGPAELVGMPASVLYAPGEGGSEAVAGAIKSALSRTGVWSGRLQSIRKDGTAFWCQADISDFKHPQLGEIRISVYQDITEHRRAADEVREGEDRYRMLFEQARDSILLLELQPDGPPTIRDANTAALRMHGYSRDELIGKPISFLDAEEDAAPEIAARLRLLEDSGSEVFEVRHRRRDGSVLVAEAAVRQLAVDGKRLVLDISRDITGRKEQERRQELTATILGLLGGPPHEGILGDILLAIKQSAGIEAAGIRFQEGEDYPYIEVGGFSPAFLKTERYLCARGPGGEPLRDDSGRVVLGCMCGNIIRGRTDPSLPFFTKGGSFWTNGTTELLATTTPEQRQAHTRNTCNKAGYESVALIPLRAKDRIIGLLQLNDRRKGRFAPDMIEYLEGLSVSIAIALDRQLAEKQNARLESDLRQSQKMEVVGRLAGGVAHDFNNLLTAILGNCGFLLRDIPKDDPRRADVEEIKKAGERAADLTRQLLAFSRKQILQPRMLSLEALLANVKKLLRRIIGEDIHLTVTCAEGLPQVKADQGQLGQVIINLAVNARDAMPKGGLLTIAAHESSLSCEQAVYQGAAVPPGRYVILTVTDTGSGIDAQALAHIFEPFFTTKGLGKGTGLGLSTVYGIVRQSDGFIDVQSGLGRGTTFKIFLPAASAAIPEEGGEEEGEGEGEEERRQNSRRTILLVEDEDAVRRTAARMLKKAGYAVLEAASAREALEHSGEDFDLLLTDIVLPDISGMELGARLKKASPGIKSIYMSGYTDNPDIREVLSRLENRFLQKPFTAKALLAKVREALA